MLKVLQLKDIVEFQSGVYRTKSSVGELLYLQMSDFNEFGIFNYTAVPSLNSASIDEKHLLKEGDILFSTKGSNNYAAVYHSEFKPAIASTAFLILKIKNEHTSQIKPEFLAWYLNNPQIQKLMKKKAVGTVIQSISAQRLSSLVIKVPSIEKQELILKAHECSQKKIQILQQLVQLENNFLQTILVDSIRIDEDKLKNPVYDPACGSGSMIIPKKPKNKRAKN